jgi:hypothetical protein
MQVNNTAHLGWQTTAVQVAWGFREIGAPCKVVGRGGGSAIGRGKWSRKFCQRGTECDTRVGDIWDEGQKQEDASWCHKPNLCMHLAFQRQLESRLLA